MDHVVQGGAKGRRCLRRGYRILMIRSWEGRRSDGALHRAEWCLIGSVGGGRSGVDRGGRIAGVRRRWIAGVRSGSVARERPSGEGSIHEASKTTATSHDRSSEGAKSRAPSEGERSVGGESDTPPPCLGGGNLLNLLRLAFVGSRVLLCHVLLDALDTKADELTGDLAPLWDGNTYLLQVPLPFHPDLITS